MMKDKKKKEKKTDSYAAAGDKQIIRRLRIKFCAIMMIIVVAFLAVVFTAQYISNRNSMAEQSENALRIALEKYERGNMGGFRPDGSVTPDGVNPQDGSVAPDGTNPQDGSVAPDGTNPQDGSVAPDGVNPQDGSVTPDGTIPPDGGAMPDGTDTREAGTDTEGMNPQDDFRNHDGMYGDYIPDFRNRDSIDGINTTPVMCVIISSDGTVNVTRNDIFFIEDEDAETLVEAANAKGGSKGVLDDYKIRFMKQDTAGGETIMAFADISSSVSLLKDQLIKSIWISLAVAAALFVVSLFVSKWAVGPVERTLRNQKRFIADASHELKTPLAVIISNTDMVVKSNDISDKNKRRLDNIKAESARMKELVQELIDLARGDNSENAPAMEEVDLSSIVTDDLLLWDPVAYDAGKTISDDVQEDVTVKGNHDKLKQLLDILIDNAIKYSDNGSEIAVSLKKNDKKAVLAVKNAGKALTEEERRKVFERFFRADESRESTPGYGLGLSIAMQIAELHKGRLYVESGEAENGGEYNIFKCEIPL